MSGLVRLATAALDLLQEEPMSANPGKCIESAAELIADADALVIAAGAGMGVDSGLPDFRGGNGFWKAYPAMRAARLDFTEVANPDLFQRNATLAWGFYGHRLLLYRTTEPHRGFEVLLRLGAAKRQGLFVFTSNVDGQFQRAGFDTDRVVECHGSIHHLQCTKPCSAEIWSADDLEVDVDPVAFTWQGPLPRCPQCGSLARPNILMFGDGAWLENRTEAQLTRLRDWLKKVRRPVVIELGAGIAVPTVRKFSETIARSYGARLVRINPNEYSTTPEHGVGIPHGALNTLTMLSSQI